MKSATLPLGVLLGALGLTSLATWQIANGMEARERLRFGNAVQRTEDRIKNRLELYTGLLRGGAAHFAASDYVSRNDFHTYVRRLDISHRYPGIQGIGFTTVVREGEAASLIARMRREGIPDFRIWPARLGEQHSILYLEPLDLRNQAAIGFDMSSNPTRRAAMVQARDAGTAAASGKVTLVQEIAEKKQAGFLIYVPIYRGRNVPGTVEGRRAALQGYVYSPFRADDLFHGIFGSEQQPHIHFRIFDGLAADEEALLHASDLLPTQRSHRPRLQSTRRIEIAGRPWTIQYNSRPEFEAATGTGGIPLPTLTALLGGLVSCLLAAITWVQARARERAESSALALQVSDAALRRSEALKSAIVETATDCVITMDHQEQILEWNPAAERTFGYSRQEVLGRRMAELIIPERYREAHHRGMAHYLETGEGPLLGKLSELEALRADGSEFPVEISIVALSQAGPPVFTAYLRDITERKASEDALRSANRQKDEFLAMLAHELRNPLGAMSNALQLMKRAGEDRAASWRACAVFERQLLHQARLVNDLLDVSRISRGKLELVMEPLDLARLVRETAEDARADLEAAGLSLSLSLPEGPVTVLGDNTRLSQVLTNLLDNAGKFTPAGGEVTVTLAADAEHRWATVTVADTGAGIERELLQHVFEPFTQAEQSLDRSRGGLGLGLSLVQRLVELHGGTVEAESDGPGCGSRFTYSLPITAMPLVAAHGPSPLPVSWHPPRRILVVEDNRDAAETLQELLGSLGYEVRIALTGPAGVKAALLFRPHVVLCDIGLPEIDGYEVARQLRAAPETAQARLIAVTGYGSEADRHRSVEAGFDVHLIKPIDVSELERVLVQGADDGMQP